MSRYLKPIKCANRSCRKEFKPSTASQRCCSRSCGATVAKRTSAQKRSNRSEYLSQIKALDDQQTPSCTPGSVASVAVRSGPPVVARSVTGTRPLSDLERRALATDLTFAVDPKGKRRSLGHLLADELPMYGRGAAIKNAVAVELGGVSSLEVGAAVKEIAA